ncbi:MAG TPA: hypothetical protein VGA98_07560 [Allosphingosinicella sp.]|jgi:hypothetical protein
MSDADKDAMDRMEERVKVALQEELELLEWHEAAKRDDLLTALARRAIAAVPEPAGDTEAGERESHGVSLHTARQWFIRTLTTRDEGIAASVLAVWERIETSRRMTLDDFDEIRTYHVRFELAMGWMGYAWAQDSALPGLGAIRTDIMEQPWPIERVVRSIAAQIRDDEHLGRVTR